MELAHHVTDHVTKNLCSEVGKSQCAVNVFIYQNVFPDILCRPYAKSCLAFLHHKM